MKRFRKEKDQGFTLIELLVVMIIIGILAAVAIPIFLSQRAKAQDTAAKADVSTLGKEIATYFVDWNGTTIPVVSINAAGAYIMTVGAVVNPLGDASNNVTITTQDIDSDTDWCIEVNNSAGSLRFFRYSSVGGLEQAHCVVD